MSHFDTLNRNQQRFVLAILTNHTIDQAAGAAGVCRRTGQRYLKKPEVRAALSEILDSELDRAVALSVGGMCKALRTLESIHLDSSLPPSARVSAARTILNSGPELRQDFDITERVSRIEALLRGDQEAGVEE